jgi:hypothetical protein
MPSTHWTVSGSAEPGRACVVLATRFTLTHRLRMGNVVSATRRLWSGFAAVDGLVGYSLRADLTRGRLSTLSGWRDEAALAAFVEGEQHSAVVAATRRWMRTSSFARWEASAAEVPPRWHEANRRLDVASP